MEESAAARPRITSDAGATCGARAVGGSPSSKHSALPRGASRVPRARLYPHAAAELLFVPPAHSAAKLRGNAGPEPVQWQQQIGRYLARDARAGPAGKGKARSAAQKKVRAAEAKRQEKVKQAGDLSCPVCAAVDTQKLFTGVAGLVGHLNSHLAHAVHVPEPFWAAQSVVRCCRVCRQAFGNTGNKVQTVCGACRKLKLNSPLPVPVLGEDLRACLPQLRLMLLLLLLLLLLRCCCLPTCQPWRRSWRSRCSP